ncbi:MAG: hypothetical protein U1E26_04265 [Coriobacteriia bacterium]|nr:hypothetical protein [Coriobacteriia bacterium]
MRRLVVALTAVLLIGLVAGCGGGEEPPAETPAEAPPPAEAAPAVDLANPIPDRSKPEDATVFEEFPQYPSLPAAVGERIAEKQPMLILFVDGSQQVTNEVRSAVDKAIDANSGLVDLIVYDIGEYTSIDASGQAVVDAEGIVEDKDASEAAVLASALKVVVTPYIVMTDDQGYLVFRSRGLIDSKLLEMHMERLTK